MIDDFSTFNIKRLMKKIKKIDSYINLPAII